MVARVADSLMAAFRAIRAGEIDDDGFNRLLIAAELDMRRSRYCAPAVATAPDRHPLQPELHGARARHACAYCTRAVPPVRTAPDARSIARHRLRAALLEQRVVRAIEAIVSPDEDRILRAFLAVIRATLRTTITAAMRTGCRVLHCRSSSTPAAYPECRSRVQPTRSSCMVRSSRACICARVRLRARHPLSERRRFSHRDSRPHEAQHVKNTVIVPVGAKADSSRVGSVRAPRECSSAKYRVLSRLHSMPARSYRQHRR